MYCNSASAGTQTAFSRPPAREPSTEGGAVLVLAARALHWAQHKVQGGNTAAERPNALRVVRKVGGLGLAGGSRCTAPAKVFLQRGVQQGTACGRQTEQRCRAGLLKLAAIF